MSLPPRRHDHTGEHGVDHLEGLVDLSADLGARQHNLAADEDQEDDLGLDHAVDETREQLRLVGAEVMMARCQTFQTDRELDVAGADDVLDLEVRELGVEAQLLDDASVFARRQLRVVFRLCPSDHHLARRKDESGCLRFADTHDHGRETLERSLSTDMQHVLWSKTVLSVPLDCIPHFSREERSSSGPSGNRD